ncbi:MAG: UvrD-helicase domain-containing protein [Bacteroidales bacterium]|nr:UvrD-helicase domain-containing protein [Bacteroidales bacterium]
MSIRILKSSAGAGKTFNLAKTYIRLLLEGQDAFVYRHILAVTFTNKATAEMKNRILKELDILARTPDKSPYIKEFAKDFGGVEAVGRRAAIALRLLLHDYSAFSVSTIDRFFQNVLRSFAREMGRFPDYQIELDRKSLVHESVDRILDSIGNEDDNDLRSWLLAGALEQIDDNGSLRLEDGLYKMAERVGNDSFRAMVEEYGIAIEDACSRSKLDALNTVCRKIMSSFEGEVQSLSAKILSELGDVGFTVDSFSNARVFPSPLVKYAAGGFYDCPSDAFLRRCRDMESWFKTSRKQDVAMIPSKVFKMVCIFADLFEGRKFEDYQTAKRISKQLYNLGLSGEFAVSLKHLMAEKNVIGIDESNIALRDIIAGSDAPFVYEKTGTRYEHFLLDEFQDTSLIQWENFRPLLAESSSAGNYNLIVGDVKQSIYRWRGGDWRLLATKIKKDFPLADDSDPLKENWRSLRAIVSYNNAFFSYAAGVVDGIYAAQSGSSECNVARDIYADAAQVPMSKDPQPGFVNVSFCEPDDEESLVIESIKDALANGARLSQIAVLVRQKKEGSAIAEALASEGIPVISGDSMKVKSSTLVRRLTALLAYAANPADKIGAFLSGSLGIEVPAQYDSLYGLAEMLMRSLCTSYGDLIKGELLYVQAFMDVLLSWTASNGNSLQQFLDYWEEQDPEISSPEGSDAVSVITVHKAKGLEFPYVIFPYAEKVGLYKADNTWCSPDVEGTAFESCGRGAFDILLSSKLKGTLFGKDYLREYQLQLIDNLNLFYVAMTRAINVLHVIAAPSAGLSTMADILRVFEEDNTVDHGCMYNFMAAETSESMAAETVSATFPSYPLNYSEGGEEEDVRIRGRLKFRSDAVDFFSPEGEAGIVASARLKGIVLHKVLSMCRVAADLPRALDSACASGLLEKGMRAEYGDFLAKALDGEAVKAWFAPGLRVLDETAVLDTDGNLYRPDRVVIDSASGRVVIIDYKFGGRKASYARQVATYCRLYRDMGYKNVEGWLWYLAEGVTEKII